MLRIDDEKKEIQVVEKGVCKGTFVEFLFNPCRKACV
jgi:hypothetical protein